MENEPYFINIQQSYQDYYNYSRQLYQNIAVKLDSILYGNVVDFGNGGIINYHAERLHKVCCMDIIFKQRQLTENKIDFIYGDFYHAALPLQPDCVLIQFLLHHLTDDRRLIEAMQTIVKSMNKRGKLIILEIAIPEYAEIIQKRIKSVLFSVLTACNRPTIRFFSEKTIVNMLKETTQGDIAVSQIDIGKRLMPAPVLLPYFKLPGKLYPFKCILIEICLNRCETSGCSLTC